MKHLKMLIVLAVYCLLFFVTYYIHISFFTVDIIFYAALFDAVFAAMITVAILFLPCFSLFDAFEKQMLVVVLLLIGYSISISVPTVIDRSLSFYMLEKLEQRGSIRLDSFEDVFTKEYAKEHRLVDVRLTEQLASGTVMIQDGCVRLTEWGMKLAGFSRYFRQNFLPKKRLLMGEYTDALTDPFRYSDETIDYECR